MGDGDMRVVSGGSTGQKRSTVCVLRTSSAEGLRWGKKEVRLAAARADKQACLTTHASMSWQCGWEIKQPPNRTVQRLRQQQHTS